MGPTIGTTNPTTTCPRSEFRHPAVKVGKVITWSADPWQYLAGFLGRENHAWPLIGWRRNVIGLQCPACGETNIPSRKPMVEQEQNGRIYCASCGRVGLPVKAADGPPVPASGLPR